MMGSAPMATLPMATLPAEAPVSVTAGGGLHVLQMMRMQGRYHDKKHGDS